MKAKIVYALIALSYTLFTNGTQLIQGNVTPVVREEGCPTNVTTTFDTTILSTTYDRANGIFWVGLTSGAKEYAVSTFQRTLDSGQIPHFKPRATETELNDTSVGFLALAADDGESCSRAAGALSGAEDVFLVNLQNKVTTSDTLRIYNPVLNENGAATGEVKALAANSCFIFAAVSDGTFGDNNSGIAVVSINCTTQALSQTAAVPGDMGIKAQLLDNQSPFVNIGVPTLLHHPTMTDDPVLYWDSPLARLYFGVSLSSNTEQAGQGIRSIVVAQVTQCPEKGTLPLFDFAPEAAFDTDEDNIVGVVKANTDVFLTVNNLGVMHTSAGPSYLILCGGNGQNGNTVYALPLVDVCDPCDPTQGKLANKDMFNATTHRFEVPVVNNADLTMTTDLFARVGAGPLPLDPAQTIYDMVVVGDAVYVSFKNPQSDASEAGLLYSQALFDQEGKIKSWTYWSKRAWPICGFPDNPSNGQVSFFNVDAVTGKIIAVDGSPQKTVRTTEWTLGNIPCVEICQTNNALAAVLDRSLCSGAYSVLDLDQSTRGIGPSIAYRYALFGGYDKVDIALISTSRAPSAPFNINALTSTPYPQNVSCNFCCPDFFKETSLPYNSCCVTSLEYARRTEAEGDSNYFFAGTQKGLFAFAQSNGSGFNVTDLGLLTAGVLANGTWQTIATITDAVIDIKSSGNALYVLTFATSCETPFSSKLLRIPFTDTLATMFDASNIFTIAQSGSTSAVTVLQNCLIFTAIDIIQTNMAGTEEQLVLATNNGLLQSQATNGIQIVTNETDAQWTVIQENTLFYGIGAVDNASFKSTDWPFSAQDPCGNTTFERSSIHQLNGTTNSDDFQFVPTFFNYALMCNNNSCNPLLYEKIAYFWSDGGRRFFIISPSNAKIGGVPCCGKKQCCCPFEQIRFLEVTPFNWCIWNVCNPLQTVIKDCCLRNIAAYYWVRHIGMTGIILAGTSSGVVALQ